MDFVHLFLWFLTLCLLLILPQTFLQKHLQNHCIFSFQLSQSVVHRHHFLLLPSVVFVILVVVLFRQHLRFLHHLLNLNLCLLLVFHHLRLAQLVFPKVIGLCLLVVVPHHKCCFDVPSTQDPLCHHSLIFD